MEWAVRANGPVAPLASAPSLSFPFISARCALVVQNKNDEIGCLAIGLQTETSTGGLHHGRSVPRQADDAVE